MAAGSKREQAAVLLASGTSIVKTAQTLGMSERGIHKWLDDPSYSARVDELRAEMLARTMGFLMANTLKAARKLRRLLDDGNSRVQLQAARAVLENASRLRQEITIEQRVAALEQAAAARAKGKQ
jgi:hypothetical protein